MMPMVLGGVSAWNDWIGDHTGHAFWVREATDLKTIDVNTSYNGDVLFRYENATNTTRWADQTVTYGNATNFGYHTIAAVVGANEGANASDAKMFWKLNCTGKDLRDNNTVSISMDLAGFGGIKPNITVYLHDANVSVSDLTGDADIYEIASETSTTALNATAVVFDTVTVEFSILDVLTAEDNVGNDNYVLVELQANTGTIEEADECYWRLYDSSLNSFGTINTASTVTAVNFILGLFCFVGAFGSTKSFGFSGGGLGEAYYAERQRFRNGRHNYDPRQHQKRRGKRRR